MPTDHPHNIPPFVASVCCRSGHLAISCHVPEYLLNPSRNVSKLILMLTYLVVVVFRTVTELDTASGGAWNGRANGGPVWSGTVTGAPLP